MTAHADTKPNSGNVGKTLTLVYGAISYLMFLFTTLYVISFFGNLIVPKKLDAGPTVSFPHALLVDLVLLGLFAVQHSVMTRPAFKRRWTRYIPQSMERSTYVLCINLVFLLFYWQWLPVRGDIWNVENTIGRLLLLGLYGFGWLMVISSTFLINHFDLFGLRQIYLHWRGVEYTRVGMKAPTLYQLVRHPLMLGFLIAFWATHDRRSPPLLAGNYRLYPGWDTPGGTRYARGPWRSLSALSTTRVYALARAEKPGDSSRKKVRG